MKCHGCSCPNHRRPRPPHAVLATAALIMRQAGYGEDQILEHSTVGVAPLARAALTLDLLEVGADHLRAVGFTYYGVWEAVDRLRVELGGSPEPPVAGTAAPEQLLLDGAQP